MIIVIIDTINTIKTIGTIISISLRGRQSRSGALSRRDWQSRSEAFSEAKLCFQRGEEEQSFRSRGIKQLAEAEGCSSQHPPITPNH